MLHHLATQDPPNTYDENELENEYLYDGIHVNLDDNEEEEKDS